MGARARRRIGTLLLGAWALAWAAPPRAVLADEAEEPPVLAGTKGKEPLPDGPQLDALAAKTRDGPAFAEKMKEAIETAVARGGNAIQGFDHRAAVRVAAATEAALAFTRGSFESLHKIWAADPKAIPQHVERCRLVAILLERRTPTDDVRTAAAFGRLAHAWFSFQVGERVNTAKVTAAATTVQNLPPGARVEAATWYVFVQTALRHGELDAAIGAWADGEVTRLVQATPDGAATKRLITFRDLWNACLLAKRGDKTAGATMAKVLLPLVPESAIAADDGPLVGLYNVAVTASRRARLPMKAPYRTIKAQSGSRLVAFELPKYTGWATYRGNGDQDDGSWVRDRGQRGKTTIRVWKYKTTIDYVDSDGKTIGGDNLGGRLKKDFEGDKTNFVKIRRASPSIGKISRGIPDSRGYELRGTDVEGTECVHQEWYFKSDVQRAMLNISVRREGLEVEDDPELEFILESMTVPDEPKGK